MQPTRSQIYDDLHHRQLEAQRQANQHSARRILSELFSVYRPSSLLDVGCGLGTWLAVAASMGLKRVRGVDGPWLDEGLLEIDPCHVTKTDLEQPIDVGEKFDLVVSLEVGEHLSEQAASTYVASLVRHGPAVLFSAAIPFQGGHHHVNERWPSFWARQFVEHEFVVVDFLRARIWRDESIMWWLRQNLLLFVHKTFLSSHPALQEIHKRVSGVMPLDVVHPAVYSMKLISSSQVAREHQQLVQLLGTGRSLRGHRDSEGRLHVKTV